MANPTDPLVLPTDDLATFQSKTAAIMQKKHDRPGQTITGQELARYIGAEWGNGVDDILRALWQRGGSGGAAVDLTPLTNRVTALESSQGTQDLSITSLNNALQTKAPTVSPALTGTPVAPTAASGTNTTQIATCAFVAAAVAGVTGGGAPLASPAFTGVPTAPTASPGTNTTQIATTAFVLANGGSGRAPLTSPEFLGDPRAPTPPTGDNDTSIATTAFVKAQGYAPINNPVFSGEAQTPSIVLNANDLRIPNSLWVNLNRESAIKETKRIAAVTPMNAWTPIVCTYPQTFQNTWAWSDGEYKCGFNQFVHEAGFSALPPHRYLTTSISGRLMARSIRFSTGQRGCVTLRHSGDTLALQVYQQANVSVSSLTTLSSSGTPYCRMSKSVRVRSGTETVYFLVKDSTNNNNNDYWVIGVKAALSGSNVNLTIDSTKHTFAATGDAWIDGYSGNVVVGRGDKFWYSVNTGVSFASGTITGGAALNGVIHDVSVQFSNSLDGNSWRYALTVQENGTNETAIYYGDAPTNMKKHTIGNGYGHHKIANINGGLHAVTQSDWIEIVYLPLNGTPFTISKLTPPTGISTPTGYLTAVPSFDWKFKRLAIMGLNMCYISAAPTAEAYI